MKFGDEPGAGKESLPGVPVVARRVRGEGALGLVLQHGEPVPPDHVLGAELEGPALTAARVSSPTPLEVSDATQALMRTLRAERERVVANEGRGAPA